MINVTGLDDIIAAYYVQIGIAIIALAIIIITSYFKITCISTLAILSGILALYLVPPEYNIYKSLLIRFLSLVVVLDLLIGRDAWKYLIGNKLLNGIPIRQSCQLKFYELFRR